jgi:hypothetical protein
MAIIEKLQNITPLKLNNSIINTTNPKELTQNILSNTQTQVGSLWIDGALFVLFIFLLYKFTDKYDLTSYDSIRGIFLSSGFTLIMSIGVLLSGWSDNIYPLFFYGVIFLISMIYTYELKKKE